MDTICISPIKDCPRYQELRVLYEISVALKGSELGIEKAFETTLSLLKRHFYMDKSIYYALNDESNELEVLSSVGLSKRQELLATYKVGEGATGLCAQFLEPVVIENVHQNILFLNKSCSLKESEISYLAIPALSQNRLFGVLGVSLTQKSLSDIEEMVTILTITASLMAQSQQIYQTINDEKKRLKEEKLYYKEEILKQNEIIGHSAVIQSVLDIVGKVACTSSTILISGETGTGKELIAKAIHNYSLRKEKPYIKLNCAAIPENLLETELFGHERGAFTDAKEMRKGRFELADEGTLFLDEVGDLSLNLQAKLLRVLQEQEFERLGGTKTIKVDVRIVAATNRDIKEMVRQGSFREDLFYRLNVIPIHSPSLRDRGDDIILLSRYFLERFCRRHAKERSLMNDAETLLKAYNWPGNIRELENCMERIVLLAPSLHVNAHVLSSVLPAKTQVDIKVFETKADLEELERQTIIKVLKECSGIKIHAAKKLGISNRQIGYKIQKFEIGVEEYL
ncbi:sigma-54-dependent Fis family transcriptional regulator [Sulfurospirillum multivorans]|uniref:Nif-specific regulatory protein NifA n=2 Tax=Sulfurospirillum multivorans TaxID=66821 RepID=A0AA86DY78_SULMK|nr:sigma 54-interacting transcriptional regulator [Sulfurospirillum multivorans]AHJ12908.1 Nif-specific regulatory protein NifA [Sulfurospirillum multivorans DSM 12446]QEH06399.1 Nif-specific regulatory protein NifA [Sulfurospirillum multivorans]